MSRFRILILQAIGCVLVAGCAGAPAATVTVTAPAPTTPVAPTTTSSATGPTPLAWTDVAHTVKTAVVRLQVDRCVGEPVVGSGFLVADGLIATAAHVAVRASRIVVRAEYGNTTAHVLGIDRSKDIALLKPDEPLSGVSLDLGPLPSQGAEVALAGFPEGVFDERFDTGRVSSLGAETNYWITDIDMARIPNAIATDTSSNPGSSGGPLVNNMGQAVGILVAKNGSIDQKSGGFVPAEGMSNAVPVSYLSKHLNQWRAARPQQVDCSKPYFLGYHNNLASLVGEDYWAARTVYLVGAGINATNYDGAYGRSTPTAQRALGPLEEWSWGLGSSRWTDFEVTNSAVTGKSAVVMVTITTTQDAEDGWGGLTCSVFHNRYQLTDVNTVWRISGVTATMEPEPCVG